MNDRGHRVVAVGVAAGVLLRAMRWARGHQLRWGADDEEVGLGLPGDAFVARADLTATRAIAIDVPPQQVWPWIAQLGQGRGGFYSYDRLENLIGCDIHSADEVVAAWQHPVPGDEVRLHPEVALSVAAVEPGRALVLRGAVGVGAAPPPYDFSWAFVLRPVGGGTRLVVRERYGYTRRSAALIVEPIAWVSWLFSRAMLRGIRDRSRGRR